MRGDVFRLRAPKDARGNEQRGARYAVIVQSDWIDLSTVQVAPTSTSARPSRLRPQVELDGQLTHVMVDQAGAVSPARLGAFAGRLSPPDMAEVDRALADIFGLKR